MSQKKPTKVGNDTLYPNSTCFHTEDYSPYPQILMFSPTDTDVVDNVSDNFKYIRQFFWTLAKIDPKLVESGFTLPDTLPEMETALGHQVYREGLTSCRAIFSR